MRVAKLFAVVSAAIALVVGVARADYAPPGSYQQSCTDIEVQWNKLTANCRTRFGDWNTTTLRDYRDCDGDIANINGELQCIGSHGDDGSDNEWAPRGSYRESCRKINVDRGTLEAECRDASGRWRYTELAGFRACEGDIFNYNGILRCRRDDYDGNNNDDGDHDGYNLSGGSWRSSCRNGRVVGRTLYATCRDFYGNWRSTTLDLRSCDDNVMNENGSLACGRGNGGDGGYGRITLYRHTNYAGTSRAFSGDVPDLNNYGFGNLTSSVVVQGGVWQLCDRPNYRGYCVVLDRSQSNLWAVGFNDRAESVRRMR